MASPGYSLRNFCDTGLQGWRDRTEALNVGDRDIEHIIAGDALSIVKHTVEVTTGIDEVVGGKRIRGAIGRDWCVVAQADRKHASSCRIRALECEFEA